MKFTILIIITSLLVACGDSSEQEAIFEHENTEEYFRMTEADQKKLAPTNMFKAIYLNDYLDFQSRLAGDEFDFSQKNDDENTALAVALELKREQMVSDLLESASREELLLTNKEGRGYMSLIVEYDLNEIFDKILNLYKAQAYIPSEASLSRIDFKDEYGKRATHYAKSYAMMDRLEGAWFSALTAVNHPWSNFYQDTDDEGNTFLHTAARYQNIQVIRWYVEKSCIEYTWEESSLVGYAARGIGNAIGDTEWLPFRRRYINKQNDAGDTPLHVAARYGKVKSITGLQACYRVDPTILNEFDRAPIAELLASIDGSAAQVTNSYKESFRYLYGEVDPTWTRMDGEVSNFSFGFSVGNNFKRLILLKDTTGWVSMHYAASMRDPYFWNYMSDFQKISIQTPEGFTPDQLRKR